jgi:hypothetical protein
VAEIIIIGRKNVSICFIYQSVWVFRVQGSRFKVQGLRFKV